MKKLILIFLFSFLFYSDSKQKYEKEIVNEVIEYSNKELATMIALKYNTETEHPFVDFCEKYQEIAIFHQIEHGIPVSIQLAQAIVESGAGRSKLSRVANNLFGMKYYKQLFNGDYYTSESGTKWRKYNSFEESFDDHALFLKKFYPNAVGKDWKFWVKNCKGYGSGLYWYHIGIVIEKYELYKYDKIVDFTIKLNKTYQI
jgi:flagellum-specific peptidoglycan hydrolase FlgJ